MRRFAAADRQQSRSCWSTSLCFPALLWPRPFLFLAASAFLTCLHEDAPGLLCGGRALACASLLPAGEHSLFWFDELHPVPGA